MYIKKRAGITGIMFYHQTSEPIHVTTGGLYNWEGLKPGFYGISREFLIVWGGGGGGVGTDITWNHSILGYELLTRVLEK